MSRIQCHLEMLARLFVSQVSVVRSLFVGPEVQGSQEGFGHLVGRCVAPVKVEVRLDKCVVVVALDDILQLVYVAVAHAFG